MTNPTQPKDLIRQTDPINRQPVHAQNIWNGRITTFTARTDITIAEACARLAAKCAGIQRGAFWRPVDLDSGRYELRVPNRFDRRDSVAITEFQLWRDR